MTRETKAAILSDAIERAYFELDTVKGPEMDTPEFRTLLKNLTDMEWLLEKATGSCYAPPETPIQPAEPTVEPEPEKPTEPAPETPKPEPEPAPETEKPTGDDGPQYKMEEVRAALAKARGKGVNVSEIIRSFGVDSFPQIDKSRYHEVMKKLEEALA